MADISILSRLINGIQRNVDLSQNSLVVGSLKVGSISPTELTKAILDKLVALQNGSDVDATYHTHDGRYFTESELGAASGTTGSDLIGDDDNYSNFTPTAATVKGALEGIDSALATAGSKEFLDSEFRVTGSVDATKKVALEVDGLTTGTTRTITMPDTNVNLGDIAANRTDIDDLRTLSGTADGATDLGTFTGTTIPDASDIKEALQALETEVELKIDATEKGAANGVATLDAGGKVPVSQLPSAVMTYEGVWNASTNSPALADGAGDAGMVYRVGTAGTQNLGSGNITFDVGDYVIYNGSIWEKSDTTDAVASVNGLTGIVVLDTDDIAEGSNLYHTDERAQDAVGTILTDSATIDFTYNDGTPSIVADVKANSISETHLTASVAGDGLTGGNGTPLAVGAGDGIDVTANAIAVDVSDLAGTGLENDGSNNLRIAASAAGAGLAGGGGSALSVAYSPKGQMSATAGESMAANTSFLVRWAVNGETAGRVYKADKDASASDKFYAIGVALKTSAVSAGDAVDVVFEGSHTLGSSDTNFNAADIGKPVYLTAAGAFSVTAPTATNEAVWRIGMVQAVDKIWVGGMQLNGIN